MVRPVAKPMTPEEYLEWELKQQTRHEYVNGYVYAMPGVSRRHSRVSMNISVSLWPFVTRKQCRLHQADVKLALKSIFYYPDVMVACGPEPKNPYYETDPCILVEVLSPSTKDIDLREKLIAYRGIASLHTYLIVDPEYMFVRHFWRDAAGDWQQEDITGSGEIRLACLEATLALGQIYQGVF
ncbi:Uma2 family endonuclease [Calidithermus chliarophilus]|uniref:Uma2 family endonuclease n=1 Tax=Calidithermus chliarophilus TaxID=52023 RepID=UPI00040835EF|nr:Uma2 family endonuclease [Calidithermus chliarophilus]